ncbi:hypothetical protein N7509_004508 [Penicillium cosmopolitanum]|uniref:Uncharacterized protein n=1 Tax=Penicillium cosmopolitanum TaxID=1131564 RepID=A0A9W9W0G9_9EURO|nr:uncharacterized protein N7509_004508 [Penicillium cosmopolitanum]KAJ5396395.1 hypothetical protein N7509_004508 [Penicillium cosmopolitanum]
MSLINSPLGAANAGIALLGAILMYAHECPNDPKGLLMRCFMMYRVCFSSEPGMNAGDNASDNK